ncbi:MAG: hypothetical protein J6U21_07880 [Bacteroidales bacterium]|nr:hypothetical protein [Bacteroidales bacterium]
MEKITIKLKCPRCGKSLAATVGKDTNIANAKIRCAGCKHIGRGSDFMFPKLKSGNDNICPKCGAEWHTELGSKGILVCPECGNSENIIQKINLSK